MFHNSPWSSVLHLEKKLPLLNLSILASKFFVLGSLGKILQVFFRDRRYTCHNFIMQNKFLT